MRDFNRIIFFENSSRLRLLKEFKKYVIEYFNNSSADHFNPYRNENGKAKVARKKINFLTCKVHDIIDSSKVNTDIIWTAPPIVGGQTLRIDLISNIFSIQCYKLDPQLIIDILEKSIGKYFCNRRASFFRTINPFFYFFLILEWLSHLPFLVIGRLGLNSSKIEKSIVGLLIKVIIYVIGFFASFITIAEFFGLQKFVRAYFKRIFGV